ncbi:MAG: GHKL domain-containing protein [Deltaproteobacteria bacterium]|nr:GHKL domain-containing protein [Deltaproteobacteria bacterium]
MTNIYFLIMAAAHPHTRTEGKQFRLVKFFAYASFLVLVIISFPFSMFVSQKAKDILLRSYEDNALLVGENVNHQVVQNFLMPVLLAGHQVRLRDQQQHDWLDQVVKNTIHGFHVDVVNIYDIGAGVVAYTTDTRLYGKVVSKGEGYHRAVKGESSSRLVSGGQDLWGLGIPSPQGEWKLITYIPMKGVHPYTGEKGVNPFTGEKGEIIGVLELLLDLTPQYRSIVKFQYFIFGLSSLIMALIFVALLFIVHKAERIIEQRAEERRILEEQLHQAERLAALGEMVAGVSHEIKNPLGIVQSTAELLGSMPNADDTQKRLSGVIREESVRLNNIVTEFLDFARPQVPNLHECHLEEIIEKNTAFLEPDLEKHHIKIHNHFSGRTFRILADQDLLYRAFLNIFINAMQAMDGGGTIDVRVEEQRGSYRVEFQDSGHGIDEENLKKIFNPFFTTKDKGSGLGLSIVRKIIESHGGNIAIESAEGQGTSVVVTLPRSG